MKYKLFLAAAVLSLILAVPITAAFSKSNNQLKIEKTTNSMLKLQIQTDQKKAEEQIKVKDAETQEVKQKNEELQKQLQSKREAQQKLASTQAAQPPVVVSAGNCEAFRGLVSQYSDWNVNVMLAIAHAESTCNPGAVSPPNYDGLRDYGLFQIHGEAIMDAAANVARAHQKFTSQGLHAWSVYSSGAYLKYL